MKLTIYKLKEKGSIIKAELEDNSQYIILGCNTVMSGKACQDIHDTTLISDIDTITRLEV